MKDLTDILDQLEIPAKRRDLDDLGNLLWLGRNLGIANPNKIDLVKQALSMIKNLAKEKMRELDVY
jgi:hypothetical protein